VRGRPFRIPLLLAPALVGVLAAGSTAPPSGPGGEPADAAAVRLLIRDARWPEAEAAARALVERRAAADGEESPGYAAALDPLVEVLVRSGRWNEPATKEMAARAVAINEQALGPDAPALATSLIRQGSIERLAGPMDHARSVSERALAIREKAFGADSLPVAEALWNLAWSVMETGDPQKAIAMHERALAIRESRLGKDDLLVADSLVGLGGVLRNTGDFQRACAVHQRALDIRRRRLRSDHPDVAMSVLSVADAKHRLGDLGGALPLYEEAKALRESEPAPDLPRLSEVLLDFGDLLTELGDLERARPLFERGVRIRDEMLGDGNFITGVGHHSYAQFLEAAGDEAGARREFERAIAIFDRSLPPPHPLRAVGRQDLGLLLKRQGDLDAAREVLQASLDIWGVKPGKPGHPFSAVPLMALGAILRDRGDAGAAEPLIDQAVAILAAAYGPEHPTYAEALLERSRLSWRKGNDGGAMADALRAEDSLRGNLRSTTRSLSESEALRYEETMLSGLDTVLSILLGSAGPPSGAQARAVFEAVGRSRTLVLDEIAARHRGITRSADPRVRGLDEALQAARRSYARLLVDGPDGRSPGGYAPRLRGAREGMERAERDLAAGSAAFANAQTRQSMTFAAIAAALPAGSALVSYVAYTRSDRVAESGRERPAYLAFVVTPGGTGAAVIPLGAAAGIEAAIERWRKEASVPPAGPAAEESYRAAAGALREAIWDPVAGRTGGARRVFVVPDAAIHALSFATLVDRQGQYLMETGPEFHYVSAERDLLAVGSPAARGRGLLALGGPDFDAAPGAVKTPPAGGAGAAAGAEAGVRLCSAEIPCADFDAITFRPLPGSAAEARRVQELWGAGGGDRARGGPVKVLTGREASEANLCGAAAGKRVLHLATHAFFVPDRCDGRTAAGAAAPPPGAAGGRLQAGTPLRVSGLALSGANRRRSARSAEDDGLLTAEEISSLDLDGVEWVVLSGCETGVGLARAGEGILGLRRSFQVAGARTLVLSLWPVSDNDTQSWMAELYRARAAGATTCDAVDAASRRIVEARRKAGVTAHPFFWGAFVAAGDWR
jgi:CHAT domain-containing protein/tetratricopeptide (TPR) repeat protein